MFEWPENRDTHNASFLVVTLCRVAWERDKEVGLLLQSPSLDHWQLDD
jgi:hypothetical protein